MTNYTDQQVKGLDSDIAAASTALQNNDVENALDHIRAYYSSQTSFRGYASDAIQVVDDTGVFGLVANQELIDALGQDQYSNIIPEVAV